MEVNERVGTVVESSAQLDDTPAFSPILIPTRTRLPRHLHSRVYPSKKDIVYLLLLPPASYPLHRKTTKLSPERVRIHVHSMRHKA